MEPGLRPKVRNCMSNVYHRLPFCILALVSEKPKAGGENIDTDVSSGLLGKVPKVFQRQLKTRAGKAGVQFSLNN